MILDAFCVDKSILAIYKTEGRSYIDDKFSPQEYGVATTKGSGLSAYVDELIQGWQRIRRGGRGSARTTGSGSWPQESVP